MISLDSVDSTSSDLIRIHEDQDTDSFMHRLASLVALIYVTFSQISQRDREEVLTTEREIKLYTKLSANAMEGQGSSALKASLVAAVVFTASFAFAHKNDQLFVQSISNQIPKIGELFSIQHAGTAKNYDAIASIKQTKLQDKSAKAQSEGNIKEAFAQVLQAEIGRLREAASSR